MSRRLAAACVLASAMAIAGCAVGEPLETTDITDVDATVHGNVYSNLDYWWRYGETSAYGLETTHETIAISDEDPHPVSAQIAELSPATTYHFQFCVKDAQESPPRICSSDQTFTTESRA